MTFGTERPSEPILRLPAWQSSCIVQLGERSPSRRKRNYPPTPPSVDPEVKAKFMLAQAKKIERVLKPLGIEVKVTCIKDLTALLNMLIQLQVDRKVEPREMRTMISACEILRRIYQPSELDETIDWLLKETERLRESFADIRKSGSDQSVAQGSPQPDPSGSSPVGSALPNPKRTALLPGT